MRDEQVKQHMDEKFIIQALLRTPDTHKKVEIIKTVTNYKDKSYSIFIKSRDESVTWKHTIKTEEI